jgi:hypothetical protein
VFYPQANAEQRMAWLLALESELVDARLSATGLSPPSQGWAYGMRKLWGSHSCPDWQAGKNDGPT